jgi:hypothetical protein
MAATGTRQRPSKGIRSSRVYKGRGSGVRTDQLLKWKGIKLKDVLHSSSGDSLRRANIDAKALTKAKISPDTLVKRHHFEARDLAILGYDFGTIVRFKFPIGEILSRCFTPRQYMRFKSKAERLKELVDAKITLKKVRELGATPREMELYLQLTPKELKLAGFTAKELKDSLRWSTRTFRVAGFTDAQIAKVA